MTMSNLARASLFFNFPFLFKMLKFTCMNYAKIIGWLVFLAGLIIIIWGLYSSFNIFTAKTAAPEIFALEEKEEVSPKAGILDIQAQMEEMIGEQFKEMLPTDFIPKLLNLIAWSIFAGILIFGGAQIAGLGIKLIKK
jgi:hypothetical protein